MGDTTLGAARMWKWFQCLRLRESLYQGERQAFQELQAAWRRPPAKGTWYPTSCPSEGSSGAFGHTKKPSRLYLKLILQAAGSSPGSLFPVKRLLSCRHSFSCKAAAVRPPCFFANRHIVPPGLSDQIIHHQACRIIIILHVGVSSHEHVHEIIGIVHCLFLDLIHVVVDQGA